MLMETECDDLRNVKQRFQILWIFKWYLWTKDNDILNIFLQLLYCLAAQPFTEWWNPSPSSSQKDMFNTSHVTNLLPSSLFNCEMFQVFLSFNILYSVFVLFSMKYCVSVFCKSEHFVSIYMLHLLSVHFVSTLQPKTPEHRKVRLASQVSDCSWGAEEAFVFLLDIVGSCD